LLFKQLILQRLLLPRAVGLNFLEINYVIINIHLIILEFCKKYEFLKIQPSGKYLG